MKIDRRALKTEAKASLRRAKPKAAWMTLLYLLLTSGVTLVVNLFIRDPLLQVQSLMESGLDPARAFLLGISGLGAIGLFLHILLLLFCVVVDFGYCWWILGSSRGGIGEVADLISGFSMVGRVILLRVLIIAFEFAWYMVIFMAIAAIVLPLFMIPVLGVVLTAAALVAALVFYASRILRYSMAVYCLAEDPEAGAMMAIRRSVNLMQGNCRSYFMLMLSFIGWYLLGGLMVIAVEGCMLLLLGGTGMIGSLLSGDLTVLNGIYTENVGMVVSTLAAWPVSLWLTPYMAMAGAKFYNRLRGVQSQQSARQTDF